MNKLMLIIVLLGALLGCQSTAHRAESNSPQDAFFARLQSLCGKAIGGKTVADEPPPAANDPFVGKDLLMQVRHCSNNEIRIPFHVGDDHSRTWVIRKTANGLQLKHDHRHRDGSPDALTLYGGDTRDEGTGNQQSFPADEESKALFLQEGRAVSIDNVWTMGFERDVFFYQLTRPNRLFRVEFDLRDPIDNAPAPWGE